MAFFDCSLRLSILWGFKSTDLFSLHFNLLSLEVSSHTLLVAAVKSLVLLDTETHSCSPVTESGLLSSCPTLIHKAKFASVPSESHIQFCVGFWGDSNGGKPSWCSGCRVFHFGVLHATSRMPVSFRQLKIHKSGISPTIRCNEYLPDDLFSLQHADLYISWIGVSFSSTSVEVLMLGI